MKDTHCKIFADTSECNKDCCTGCESRYYKNEMKELIENERQKAYQELSSTLLSKCDGIISEPWNKEAQPTSWADAYEAFKNDIEDVLSSFQDGHSPTSKQNLWIPTSQELPKSTKPCYVTCLSEGNRLNVSPALVHFHNGKWYLYPNGMKLSADIVAWQYVNIPDPYIPE